MSASAVETQNRLIRSRIANIETPNRGAWNQTDNGVGKGRNAEQKIVAGRMLAEQRLLTKWNRDVKDNARCLQPSDNGTSHGDGVVPRRRRKLTPRVAKYFAGTRNSHDGSAFHDDEGIDQCSRMAFGIRASAKGGIDGMPSLFAVADPHGKEQLWRDVRIWTHEEVPKARP